MKDYEDLYKEAQEEIRRLKKYIKVLEQNEQQFLITLDYIGNELKRIRRLNDIE